MTVIDSFYVETGKFFLDGDASGAYLEVTDKTVQLLGTDLEAFFRYTDEKYPFIDPATGEKTVTTDEVFKSMAEEYSAAQEYVTVEIIAPETDYHAFTLATSYYNDGESATCPGYSYDKETRTISSFGGEKFILA